eukprot:CAMPEP_0168771720 /NCGR_PEP_ID=MMETSP0725-20121227/3585_1 /TAXON_ID=265536 /ORGANISM="Amphiprora sp., Strain CCMP467" /LENGTH=362 /DNA_ID=CAMNT_0008821213 /DNA_START=401 /DNA_END=1489 /DNA_ORIENTATION=-
MAIGTSVGAQQASNIAIALQQRQQIGGVLSGLSPQLQAALLQRRLLTAAVAAPTPPCNEQLLLVEQMRRLIQQQNQRGGLESVAALRTNNPPQQQLLAAQQLATGSTLDAINQHQRMQLEEQFRIAQGGSFLQAAAANQRLLQQKLANHAPTSLVDRQQRFESTDDSSLVGRAGHPSTGSLGSIIERKASTAARTSSRDLASASFQQAMPKQYEGRGIDPKAKSVTQEEARKKGGGIDATHVKKQTFPEKVYYMLEDVEEQDNEGVGSHIISFVAEGTAFLIHNPRLFETDVMPLYFSSTRSSSFQRQLNIYGFERVEKGPWRGAYRHPSFLKGKPELLHMIVRGKSGRANHSAKKEKTGES